MAMTLLALDEALDKLASRRPSQSANLVKLRFFAGLTMDEAAAAALGISVRNCLPTLGLRPSVASTARSMPDDDRRWPRILEFSPDFVLHGALISSH